jgi:hypothetical protein
MTLLLPDGMTYNHLWEAYLEHALWWTSREFHVPFFGPHMRGKML